ncbi:MAG: radical SAM protein [Candidatus Omnitrophota bacterium]
MKIQFVFAPTRERARLGELSEGRTPALSLLYLAAYLRKSWKGTELKMRFEDGLLLGMEKTLLRIKEFRPDLLAVSFYTPQAEGAYELINNVKSALPETFVAAGGVHATALPEEVFERSRPDAVVIGEGEETFSELVGLLGSKGRLAREDLRRIPGIAFAEDGQMEKTLPRPFIRDLDSIPFPAYDLIDLKDYKGWYLNKGGLEAPLFSARGCPYWCTFCSNVIWKAGRPTVRLRSPKNIADEIEWLVKECGVNEIYDCSDEFNNNIHNALAICREIRRRNLKVRWKTSLRADRLPEELVKEMAPAGCWYALIGIESGNERTLEGINKKIELSEVETSCKLLKKYGIKVQGLFMLYNVWEKDGRLEYETTAEVRKTLDYAYRLVKNRLLDYVGWSITVPYPGSKLYDIAQKYDLIRPEYRGKWEDWLKKDSYVLSLPGISISEQVHLKTIGSILRAKLILRQGEFNLKDIPWLVKKGIKILANELKTR